MVTSADGMLTTTGADGVPESDEYCVKGSTLTVTDHSDSSMMGVPVVSGILVWKKP